MYKKRIINQLIKIAASDTAPAPGVLNAGLPGKGAITNFIHKVTPYAGTLGGAYDTRNGIHQFSRGIANDNLEDLGMGAISLGSGTSALLGGMGSFAPALAATAVPFAAAAGTLSATASATNALTNTFGVPLANSRLDNRIQNLANEDGSYDADKTYNNRWWAVQETLNHMGDQVAGIATAPKQIYDYFTKPKVETRRERNARLRQERQAQ